MIHFQTDFGALVPIGTFPSIPHVLRNCPSFTPNMMEPTNRGWRFVELRGWQTQIYQYYDLDSCLNQTQWCRNVYKLYMLYIYIFIIFPIWPDHSIFIHIQHLRHSHPTPMPRISWGVAAGDQEVSLSDLRGARGIWIKIGWSRCLMDKFPANQFRGSYFF